MFSSFQSYVKFTFIDTSSFVIIKNFVLQNDNCLGSHLTFTLIDFISIISKKLYYIKLPFVLYIVK